VPGWIFFAIVVSLIPHDMMYGPQAALIAECFSPRLRYTGASLGFHLASLIAGGPAPLIATALLASTGSGYSVAIYILVCAIVSISATIFLPEERRAKAANPSTGPEVLRVLARSPTGLGSRRASGPRGRRRLVGTSRALRGIADEVAVYEIP
jgi:hypothetical protein